MLHNHGVKVLDVSTGNLSLATRELLSDPDSLELKNISVARREEGFFINSIFGSFDPKDMGNLPPDLYHIMRLACANDYQYVLFDMDAEILEEAPYYEDSNEPVHEFDRFPLKEFNISGKPIKAVDVHVLSLTDLVVPENSENTMKP